MQINSLPASTGVNNTDNLPLQTAGNVTQRATVSQLASALINNQTAASSVNTTDSLMIQTAGGTVEKATVAQVGTALNTQTQAQLSTGSGYVSGTGASVTQTTSKTTPVTINKAAGQITTNNSAMGFGTIASFLVNNTTVTATDVPIVALQNAPANPYTVTVSAVSAGSFKIQIANNSTAGNQSDVLVINFVVLNGATS